MYEEDLQSMVANYNEEVVFKMEWLLFNFLLQIDDQLCSIGSVLQPSWKQNFRSKDQ